MRFTQAVVSILALTHCLDFTNGADDAPTVLHWKTDDRWHTTADGGFIAQHSPSELESRDKMGDFGLSFQFQYAGDIPSEVPLSLQFRSSALESGYALLMHKALGILLHQTGHSGPIAGLAPGAPWPPGSSPRLLKPEHWYAVRLQAVGPRISAKIWSAEESEPNSWGIDIRDSSFTEGVIRLSGQRGAEVAPVTLTEPMTLREPTTGDLRTLRYKRREHQATEFQLLERSDEIEVRGERARLVFSRRGCAVSVAHARSESFPVGHLPDLRYVTPDGTEYRQSYADDGQLEVKGHEGRFLVLEGSARPANAAGQPGPARFAYRYRVHRDLGMVLVSARCLDRTPVRRFEFVNSLADRAEQGVDILHASILWGQGKRHPVVIKDRWGSHRASINVGPVSREDRVIAGEQLMFGRWTSGKVGFEVQALSYRGSYFSPRSSETKTEKVASIQAGGFVYSEIPLGATMLDDLTAEKYLVARTRDGKRALDLVFINLHPQDAPINIALEEYTFAFQFLPFRKYRPNLWLNGYIPLYSWCVEIDSISRREEVAREAARMGLQATHLGVGHLPHTLLADLPSTKKPLAWHRVKACVESLHAAGLRVAPGWWWSSWDCGQYLENGWVSSRDIGNARAINHRVEPDQQGLRKGAYPHSHWIDLCFNDRKFRETMVEKVLFGWINQLDCDGVYLDGFVPWIPCENSRHGCEGPSRQAEGYIALVDQFRELAKRCEPLEGVLWGHPGEHVYGPHGLSDIAYLGEMFVAPWVPTTAELEGYFSSLLHGSQVVYCSAPGNGGPDWEDVRVYEGALSRCSLVQAPDPVVNAWMEGRLEDKGLKLWRRCMMPLGIFDINDSEVHHPFDVDYSEYARLPKKGTGVILYHRPGDVLLVAVREIDSSSPNASIDLDARSLGFDGPRVWVFDTESSKLESLPVENGRVQIGALDLEEGPRLLRIVDAKESPQVVWNDQVVWRTTAESDGLRLSIDATGVPESDGLIFVAWDKHPVATKGEILNFDPESSLATLKIHFDATGQAKTELVVVPKKRLSYADLLARLTDLEGLAVLPGPDEKCAQVSSYDQHSRYDSRTGTYLDWDANIDNGSTETTVEGDKIVIASIKGPGCVWRMWSAGAKEGPFQLYLDGAEQPILDMPFRQYFDGSAEHWPPLDNKRVPWPPKNSVSVPPFGPEPLGVRGWASGTALFHCVSRGWNSYIPIPFQKSFKVLSDKWIPPYNHDGWGMFYQYTYETFAPGTRVPKFDLPFSPEDRAALEATDRALSELGEDPADQRIGEQSIKKTVHVSPGSSATLVDLVGPRAITSLKIKIELPPSPDDRDILRAIALRITWDDDESPGVWSPLGDFFGTTPGFNKYRSLPLGMTDEAFYCYWYMPFATRAHVEIVNDDANSHKIECSVVHAPLSRPIEELGRFHAKWHRDAFIDPARPIDWTMLKTRGHGRYVGTMLHIWCPGGGWWGEGDEKFFVDDEKFPSFFGTGTEDYFGYAWADPNLFSNAFHNQTFYAGRDGHSSLNRWHLGDNVPFQTSFESAMEKYFPNDRPTLYSCVAYWYLAPGGVDPYGPVPLEDRIGYYKSAKQ